MGRGLTKGRGGVKTAGACRNEKRGCSQSGAMVQSTAADRRSVPGSSQSEPCAWQWARLLNDGCASRVFARFVVSGVPGSLGHSRPPRPTETACLNYRQNPDRPNTSGDFERVYHLVGTMACLDDAVCCSVGPGHLCQLARIKPSFRLGTFFPWAILARPTCCCGVAPS